MPSTETQFQPKSPLAPKENEDEQRQERDRSTIEFPYLSLDIAIEIAKGVHSTGGSQCQWDQLAAHLNSSASGGAFRNKVVTSRTFGLTVHSGGTVTLTPLGSKIVDPEQERSARADAFLNVQLYKAIYEKFKNGTLPPQQGLEAAMVNLGVATKQKERARQAFQRSAKEAGFFAYGSTKLVYPIMGSEHRNATKDKSEEEDNPRNGRDSGPGKGSDGGEGFHPLIEGLIKALPRAGAEWPLATRKKWLQTAAMNFDYVYAGSADSDGSIKVTISVENENSAK